VTVRLSVLDVSPVPSGSTAGQALRNTVDLARRAEAAGCTRYWLAEHHNSPGIASSSPEVMIGQVAAATSTMRVGSGGVMLPNHSPLRVAEAFRVLEALFPGRIDLGLGRAPGTDALTAYALRRSREAMSVDDFPEQLAELLAFLADDWPTDHPFAAVTAVPAGVGTPQLWILGSSGYGAQAAAALGLGAAFASHIAPGLAVGALQSYRQQFRPTAYGAAPRSILAAAVVCAETDELAEELAASSDLAWLRIGQGRSGLVPSPAEAHAYDYTAAERAQVAANRSRFHVGSPATVARRLTALAAQAGADEVMVLSTVHDHEARVRSYELLAAALGVGRTVAA